MIDHDHALELAAAALDFPLSDDDRAALQAHLDGCDPCRTTVEGLRVDARRIADLAADDAPDHLRARILAAISAESPAETSTTAAPASTGPRVLPAIPPRYRLPVALLATAAVVVALIGGTLYWRSGPNGGPDVAVATPSPSGATASGQPTPSGQPGSPDDSATWKSVADLTADDAQGGIVALASGFHLASLDGTPAAELAKHLSAQPPLAFTVTAEADGRSARITPNEPLTAGVAYRFTLAAPDGRTLDSWAFQAHQALQVASTVPGDQATGVPTNTGIEVTFDQDGVVDPASHISIAPKVAGRFEQHGRTIVFVPAKRLAKATIYTVTVTKGVAVMGTSDALEADVRFRFETTGAPTTGNARIKFEFTNDVFDSATSERPEMAVWADPAAEDKGDQAPPKSTRIVVDRLPDLDTAIAAYRQVRAFPDWARGSSAPLVPTKGLVRVADFTAKLTPVDVGYLGFLLPKRLAAGWYVVTLPSANHPVQSILQVTDIAGYLVVSDTKTLVWANDLATKGPISGATVAADEVDLGQTESDGSRMVATPAILKGSSSGSCTDECVPVVTVRSGDRALFLPAERGALGELSDFYGFDVRTPVAPYWSTFNIDRTLYRRTDTVNFWGVARDRTTGKVPGSVSVRLSTADPYRGDSQGAPLSSTDATPNGIGAYSGSVALDDLPEGDYVLESRVGDEVLGSTWFRVDRILKPAYRLEVTTGRRVYFQGDQVKVTATATFFEGSPAAGVPLRLEGLIEKTFKTDARGTATTRTTIHVSPDYGPGEPEVQEIAVSPARAEEGQITGVSRQIIAYPSQWTVDATASVEGGTAKVTGSVHAIDRDRLENELAQGADIWSLDPKGDPIADRTVTARFTELIPYHIPIGSHYDFIEKTVVTDYEDGVNERSAGSVTARTGADGTFSASIGVPDATHTYRVDLSATDPDKHAARWRGWASVAAAQDESSGAPQLALTAQPIGDSTARASSGSARRST